MGVIINLKEIFAADGQEIFTDKINFNFNKLLELGIGEQGDPGIQGPVGAAGPPGIQGNDGQRGNRWFIGIGDPNTLVFTDLIIGDFYLETNDSSIWQYQGSPASWVQITDLSQVVINILEAEGQPFVRGFGEFSPLDDRFITFAKRGNDPADITLDISLGNNSNNDTLLLTNWNERVTDISNFPMDTSEEYNSLQTISVDHTVNTLGRYHLEFGSLYESPTSPGITELSSLNHNLKVRYLKGTDTPINYLNSNQFINRARFSLTIPESGSPVNISEQGVFEFIAPKYNADGSPIQDNLTVRIGTTEPITEISSIIDIAVDGLDITSDAKGVNLGLVRELETFTNIVTLTPDLEGDWGMINISANLAGLMIRGNTYYSNSLSTIHTSSVQNEIDLLNTIGVGAQGYQGIFSDGKWLMAVSPTSDVQQSTADRGYLQIYDISDPDNPLIIHNISQTSEFFSKPTPLSYDIHGNPYGDTPVPGYANPGYKFSEEPALTGVRDISFAGKYGVLVRRRPLGGFAPFTDYVEDSFIVFELDSDKLNPKIISWLGENVTFSTFMTGSSFEGTQIPELDKARRVKISGNWAYVMTSGEDMALTETSYFMAIDITNPARPYIDSTYIADKTNSRHIDFDIHGETAYILSQLGGSPNSLSVIKINLFNSQDLENNINVDTQLYSFGLMTPSTANGSIKVFGNRVYVVSETPRKLLIYEDSGNPSDQLTQISDTDLPSGYKGYDIEVSGKYAYVYAEDISSSRSILLTYDISDNSSPVLIEPYQTFPSANGNGLPSKMTMVGDRIYTIAAANGTVSSGVSSIKIDGINSPAAKIGNLHSKDIKVSNNLAVSQNLQVGRSAAIGSGGLWVDKGAGINTDSGININLSNLSGTIINNQPIGIKLESTGAYGDLVSGIDINLDSYTLQLSGEAVGVNVNIKNGNSSNGITKGQRIVLDNIDAPQSSVTGNEIQLTDNTSANIIGQSIILDNNQHQNFLYANPSYGLNISINNNNVWDSINGLRIAFSGNTLNGFAEKYGINITGSTLNILDGDLDLDGDLELLNGGDINLSSGSAFNGPLSTTYTTLPQFAQLDVNSIRAGSLLATGHWTLHWQKIGNVVMVTGSRTHNSHTFNGNVFAANEVPYPVKPSSGLSIVEATGNGVNSQAPDGIPIEAFPSTPDKFIIRRPGSGTSVTAGTSRFTLSYRIA